MLLHFVFLAFKKHQTALNDKYSHQPLSNIDPAAQIASLNFAPSRSKNCSSTRALARKSGSGIMLSPRGVGQVARYKLNPYG